MKIDIKKDELQDLNSNFIKKTIKKKKNGNYSFIPTTIDELTAILDMIIMDSSPDDLEDLNKNKKIIFKLWKKHCNDHVLWSILKWILEFLKDFLIIVLIVSAVRVFLVSPFKVS